MIDMLKGKIGPLPMWAWLGIITALGLGYYLLVAKKKSAAAAAATATTPATPEGFAQVPETVNQTTVNATFPNTTQAVTPPVPPPVGTTPVTPTPPAPPSSPSAPTVDVPNVIGQRANFAIGELKSGPGLSATTSPVRNPKDEYTVTSEAPAAGTKVPKGSGVVLGVKALPPAAATHPATAHPAKAA
jgi:hypothetical protein